MFLNTHMHNCAQELPHACTYACLPACASRVQCTTKKNTAPGPRTHSGPTHASRSSTARGSTMADGCTRAVGCQARGRASAEVSPAWGALLAAPHRGCAASSALQLANVAVSAQSGCQQQFVTLALEADGRGGTWAAGWQTPRLRGPAPFLAEVDCFFLLFPKST